MIIIYTLAGMWSLGCIALLLVMLWYLATSSDWGGFIAALLLGLPIAAFIAALPWATVIYSNSPDLATLKKSEWACARSELQTTYVPVSSGKTTVVVPTTTSKCVTYNRVR